MTKTKELKRNELRRRICVAARRVGLADIVIREWDSGLIGSWFTDGVVREHKKDHGENHYRMDEKVDIGYLERDHQTGEYTRTSFRINPLAFTPEKSQDFVKELEAEGLIVHEFAPWGMIFPNPERQRKLEERNKTALYR